MAEIIIHQDWYGEKIDQAVSAIMRLDRLEQTGFTGRQLWRRSEWLSWPQEECQESIDCMRCEMEAGIDSLINERDSVRARTLQAR